MKNKKTIALAMAAATVAPMAVPAVEVFAAQKSILDQTTQSATIDVMLSNGYKIYKTEDGRNLLYRDEVFDQNGTEYTSDDTIKTTFGEGAKVLAVKEEGLTHNLLDDRYVVIKKATSDEVVAAKERIALANAEIAQLEKDGYKITTTNYAAKYEGYQYVPSQIVKKATLQGTNIEKTFIFNGTENVKDDDTLDNLAKLFETFNVDKPGKTVKLDLSNTNKTNYGKINTMKYIIESNLSKFDIVKYETNFTTINGGYINQDLVVDIYKKGAKGVNPGGKVITVVFKNFAKVDKDLIINIPSKTDIDGHWAEADIKEAMLLGYVDASATFRPKAGITRAEFAKMLCEFLNINADKAVEQKKEEPFHDVTSSDWHYKYIVALYNNHGKKTDIKPEKGTIIGGYKGDVFKPNAKITRIEAAKMLASALEIYKDMSADLTNSDLDIKDNGFDGIVTPLADGIVDASKTVKVDGVTTIVDRDIKTSFVDDKDIAAWGDEAVETLKLNAIASGNPDGTFKPKSEINRVEALLMIQRLATK